MKLAQDAHTRAEQQVYEYLWENAKPLDTVSRTLTIGFGVLSRLVRLSESNTRINLRALVAKLAVEEAGAYNCERSVGRTYRVFNYSEILRRRREAGLVWYMRRTLAVVFVDPATGLPLHLGLGKLPAEKPAGPGLKLDAPPGINLIPAPGLNLDGQPGLNLTPLYREELREEYREGQAPTSPSDAILFQALAAYGNVDDDAVARLRDEARRICPDCTSEEIVHFIHTKGQLVGRRGSLISSPIGFLLTSVPKCLAGEAFQLFRKAQQEARRREAADRARQDAEVESWRREQQAVLDDPHAAEEDKRWARRMLFPEDAP